MEKWTADRRDGGIGIFCGMLFLNFLCFNTSWSKLDLYRGSWGLQALALSVILMGVLSFIQMCWKWSIRRSVCRAGRERISWKPSGDQQHAVKWCALHMTSQIFIYGLCGISLMLYLVDPAGHSDMIPFIGGLISLFIGRLGRYSNYKFECSIGVRKKGVPYPKPLLTVAIGGCLFVGIAGSILASFCPMPFQQEMGKQNYFLSFVQYEEDPYVAIDYGKTILVGRNRKHADLGEDLLDKRFSGGSDISGKRVRIQMDRKAAAKYGFENFGEIEKAYYYPERRRILLRSGNTIGLQTIEEEQDTPT